MDRKPGSRGPRSPRGFKEAEEKYRHLLEDIEDINDGYLLIQEGEAVFANRRCAEIFGYQLEEIVGQPYGRFVVREVVKIAMEAQGRVRASGQVLPERYETMVLNKGGIEVPVEVSIKRIEYEGRPAFSAIVRDITERKRAEEALRQSEHKYRTAIDTARDGFLILDLDYSIVDSNRTNTMALGYTSSEELIGRSALEFVTSDTRGKTREGLEQALSKGYIANLEVVALSRDGREIPLEVNISLLTGEEGQPAGFVLVIRDIRRRKQAQEEILRRSRELSALNAIAATVSQSLKLEELLNDVLEKVLE
ncbi:MAG: PAS domain S-box protein, partial [Dehalococcoidia bacterium]